MGISSSPYKVLLISLSAPLLSGILPTQSLAQPRRAPAGGPVAIVVDERLSVLRATPDLSGKLLRRIGRGRLVAIRGQNRSRDGVLFYSVNLTRRTRGWLQKEAVILPRRPGEDARLLRLIKASEDFDRVARARIFLDAFPYSPLRPTVLLLFGDAAEQAAARLSHDAARRLEAAEMQANGAPLFTYSLNYSGLDRYNRQGVRFAFDREQRKFHYDGAAWREIVRRYPHSLEAAQARTRLAASVPEIK